MLLFDGTGTVHSIEPPGRMNFGVQEYAVVFVFCTCSRSLGFASGYFCVFVRKNATVVACVVRLVATIMSLQYAPSTKLHVFGTMFAGADV